MTDTLIMNAWYELRAAWEMFDDEDKRVLRKLADGEARERYRHDIERLESDIAGLDPACARDALVQACVLATDVKDVLCADDASRAGNAGLMRGVINHLTRDAGVSPAELGLGRYVRGSWLQPPKVASHPRQPAL
jgi:hypothetical protein